VDASYFLFSSFCPAVAFKFIAMPHPSTSASVSVIYTGQQPMKPALQPPHRPAARRLPQPGKKTVTFSSIVRFAAPPQRDDFEKEDLKSLWYNRHEMMDMKMHDRITISLMRKGKIQPDEDLDYCFRGLECRVRAGATQRQHTKFRAALTMILEQDRQWNENDYDVELLADIYFKVSFDSFCDAYERAIKDEKEARAYYANLFPEVLSN
jgi:hypothetical protein